MKQLHKKINPTLSVSLFQYTILSVCDTLILLCILLSVKWIAIKRTRMLTYGSLPKILFFSCAGKKNDAHPALGQANIRPEGCSFFLHEADAYEESR
jgi:hypothetical protein